MEGSPCPEHYNVWAFLWGVSATLQRRVWSLRQNYNHVSSVFPNIYCVLIASSGVGKSYAINHVKKHILGGITKKSEELQKRLRFPDPVIPFINWGIVNDTTQQALYHDLFRYEEEFSYPVINDKGIVTDRIAKQRAIAGSIDEITTLIDEEKKVDFLTQCWSAPEFVYKTKHGEASDGGGQIMENPALALIGCTTPKKWKQLTEDQIVQEGFAARCIALFGTRPPGWEPPPLFVDEKDEKVKEAVLKEIVLWFRKLSNVAGYLKWNPDVIECFEKYRKELMLRDQNPNEQLSDYYRRKDIHLVKVTMCIHFAEKLNMEIDMEDYEKAFTLLNEAEKTMHLAHRDGSKAKKTVTQMRTILKIVAENPQIQGFAILRSVMQEGIIPIRCQTLLEEMVSMRLLKIEGKFPGARYKLPEGKTIEDVRKMI